MVESSVSFWQVHPSGVLLLLGLALFPRITTLFIGGPFGLLSWVGWVFAPHLLVAVLATATYWHTDPLLCVISWFFAFAGTGGEGRAAHWGARRRRRDDPQK